MRGGGSQTTQHKWKHINQLMRDNKIATLAIQETHLSPQKVDELNQLFSKSLYIVHSGNPDRPNAKGVAFALNKKETRWQEIKATEVIPGHALHISLPWQVGHKKILILAIYAPNAAYESKTFFKLIKKKWTDLNLPKIDIMLGDFNIVEDTIDRLPAQSIGDYEAAVEAL
jgi:exonuclease III